MIIITTHSSATISLAPDYATFYEMFRQDNDSPKILKVQRGDYAEMQVVNKDFYNKISNQKSRIKELENERTELVQNKPILFVEDTYTQIYKLAWLKLNDIDFNQDDIDNKFDVNARFSIYGKGNKDNLQGFLNNPCMNEWNSKTIAGLFDFDDAYQNYQKLKTNISPWWTVKSENEVTGLYKKRALLI
ncbi:hypothetical protein EZS27_019513 [termite gut metagenome]|uniref:Uncharacterized protein n=1 Tax=termite gut metagenome TaxID=433724 RepID=A0A5J4RE63_9ZZZZ